MDIGPQEFNPIVWALPALCDSTATTSMYVGLNLTHASDFQMLRGAVIIFTGLMARLLLGTRLASYKWVGMVTVLMGLVLVGLSGFLDKSAKSATASNPVLGDVIIIAAQVVVAFQMVIEQKLMEKYKTPPLQAVGWEGVFGMIIMVNAPPFRAHLPLWPQALAAGHYFAGRLVRDASRHQCPL